MRRRVVFYYAFAFNPSTGEVGDWMGTARPATIKKHGLAADLRHPLYEDESVAVDGWAYRAR